MRTQRSRWGGLVAVLVATAMAVAPGGAEAEGRVLSRSQVASSFASPMWGSAAALASIGPFRYVVYVSARGALQYQWLQGDGSAFGPPVALTNGASRVVSFDASGWRIAYSLQDGSDETSRRSAVYSLTRATTPLVHLGATAVAPRVASLYGNLLVFAPLYVGPSGIWVCERNQTPDCAGAQAIAVPPMAEYVSHVDAGSRFVVWDHRYTSGILVYDLRAGATSPVDVLANLFPFIPGPIFADTPATSRSWIVFAAWNSAPPPQLTVLAVWDARTSTSRVLHTEGSVSNVAVDGSIAASSLNVAGDEDVFLDRLDREDGLRLAEPGNQRLLAIDGQLVAYASGGAIWVARFVFHAPYHGRYDALRAPAAGGLDEPADDADDADEE